jgi:hypothetical protein
LNPMMAPPRELDIKRMVGARESKPICSVSMRTVVRS